MFLVSAKIKIIPVIREDIHIYVVCMKEFVKFKPCDIIRVGYENHENRILKAAFRMCKNTHGLL